MSWTAFLRKKRLTGDNMQEYFGSMMVIQILKFFMLLQMQGKKKEFYFKVNKWCWCCYSRPGKLMPPSKELFPKSLLRLLFVWFQEKFQQERTLPYWLLLRKENLEQQFFRCTRINRFPGPDGFNPGFYQKILGSFGWWYLTVVLPGCLKDPPLQS